MRPNAPRHALGWLDQEAGFRALADRAQRLLALQEDLRRSAAGLELTALGVEHDCLLVGTPGAAVAAKLRQMEPTIVEDLYSRGWQIKRIRFRPQPKAGSAAARFEARAAIPASALARLGDLAKETSSPALKEALANLLRGQRRP